MRLEQTAVKDNSLNEEPIMANSMLVFLVRGIFTKLLFPYAQFPCCALSGDQIYQPFWEAVSRIELCGLKVWLKSKTCTLTAKLCDVSYNFKVMALTCDGLAANRRLFRLHNPDSKGSCIVHKTRNPFDPTRLVLDYVIILNHTYLVVI